ncbi:MAG: NADH-quinone oxidoreductase subunit L [Thermoflexales bacterium]|nr:NADH-quinone oxidoreductase subunit L [Thermoflexales bacterium]
MHEAVTEVPQIFSLAWLIIVIPVIGLLINTFGGKNRSENEIGWTAVIAAGGAFFVALLVVIGLLGLSPEERMLNHGVDVPLFTFFELGPSKLEMGLHIDALTGVMLMVVTFVGTLIHIYAIGYMHGDSRFQRFFIYLNLFMAAMLILVLANNYLMLFVGWEGVGLCSFLLIGFWFEKDANGNAAKKAMVANRVGDYGVMLAMFAMFIGAGTLQFAGVFERAEAGEISASLAMLVTLLLVVGVTGKSAQIPLYVWLPDAMAGPTPVSALIHAATMVTAGVYLIARSEPLFHLVPEVQSFVGILGAVTALFAGSVALAQFDIKKVLAYSTVSQLGFMVAAVGMGATVAGVFHLMTHAFFKALLFLGAGSVIHGVEHGHHHVHEHAKHAKGHGDKHGDKHGGHDDHHKEEAFDPQDMRNMGGLWYKMRTTSIVYIIGSLALAGIFPLAGFWSKDEILLEASHKSPVAFVLLLIAAGFTAFYMTRQVLMVFFGKPKSEAAAHAPESVRTMTTPLIVLAVFSVLIGFINAAPFGISFFSSWLEGEAHGEFDFGIAIGSTVLALGAIGLGYLVYNPNRQKAGVDDPLRKAGFIFTVLNNKYWIDQLYGRLFVKPFIWLSEFLAKVVDWKFWHDWFHESVIYQGFMSLTSFLANPIDKLVIDGAVNGMGKLVAWASSNLRTLQTGFVRNYALMMLAGVVFVVAWFAFAVVSR